MGHGPKQIKELEMETLTYILIWMIFYPCNTTFAGHLCEREGHDNLLYSKAIGFDCLNCWGLVLTYHTWSRLAGCSGMDVASHITSARRWTGHRPHVCVVALSVLVGPGWAGGATLFFGAGTRQERDQTI